MKKLLIVLLLVLWSGVASAGQIWVSTTAESLPDVTSDVQSVLITLEGGPIRMSLDGTPTIAVGHLVYSHDLLVLNTHKAVTAAKFISESGATLTYTHSISRAVGPDVQITRGVAEDTKTWNLYVGTTAAPVTMSASSSGSSVFNVLGPDVSISGGTVFTIGGLDRVEGSAWGFQLNYISPVLSGTSYFIEYAESLYNDEEHWKQVSGTTIFARGSLTSGTSLEPTLITPQALGYMRIKVGTQGSQFTAVEGILKAYNRK